MCVCKIRHKLTSSILQPPVRARPSGRRACLSRRCAPVPLHCHVSCLQTSRLSCSHTGTCGFKCDPDLYGGQGVREGEEEEEEGERREEGKRERVRGEERRYPANIPFKCSKVAGLKRRGAKPTCHFSRSLCARVTLKQIQQWACKTNRELEEALMQRNGLWVPFSAPTLYLLYRII